MMTGLFHPVLLLPHEDYEPAALRFILRHELCHLKRHDLAYKLVLTAANAVHWFDPLVYWMLRQADEDVELACDSRATEGMAHAERTTYGETLLAAVQAKIVYNRFGWHDPQGRFFVLNCLLYTSPSPRDCS